MGRRRSTLPVPGTYSGGPNGGAYKRVSGFPLYFGIKIQGLSRTMKLHFQGPILDRSLQHGQQRLKQCVISISVITGQF